MTGSRCEQRFLPLPADDLKQRQTNITLARSTLGWEPTTSLREGLEKTIAYFDVLLARGVEINAWQLAAAVW